VVRDVPFIVEYVELAGTLPTYLAWPVPDGAEPVGVLLAARHFPNAAELYLMAVGASSRHWRPI
jgi:hypothetical protein